MRLSWPVSRLPRGKDSAAHALATRVVQGLAGDLGRDPVTEDADLHFGADLAGRHGQVRVGDRASHGVAEAARGDPADDLLADAYRLVAGAHRPWVVQRQAAQPPGEPALARLGQRRLAEEAAGLAETYAKAQPRLVRG